MTYSPYEPAPPERDRWGLNLPLAVGVVAVFLIAVVTWVVIDATRGDDTSIGPTVPPPAPASSTVPVTVSTPSTTTPPLLPVTIPVAPTSPTLPTNTTPSPTAAPPVETTAPAVPPTSPAATSPTSPSDTVPDGAVPGDLGVPNRPMQRPVCSGGYITVLGSNVASRTSAAGIAQLLEQYPGSEYLRTDQSCRSLDRSGQGEPIYVVFLGPFPEASDACIAREQGPSGAYARQLSDDVGPDHGVNCP
ncbi:MAG TPA: hypothetical protein VNQ73_21050 [Ilumatobacter sp.]|nr:hypothetical protein [Ilumatobacter sp.]